MATNPTITPYGTAIDAYVVGDSDTAYYDVLVSSLTDGAEFTITAPAGAEVHAWRSATLPVPWDPAGSEVALLTGGAWQSGVTLGPWNFAISSGTNATDPAIVTVTAGSPAGGPLRVRVTGIRTSGATETATLQAGSNAETLRILADPSIIGTPGPAATPVAERSPQTLVGNPSATVEEAGTASANFGALPSVRGTWERTTGVLAFILTPVGTADAEFMAPGVYEATEESFLFRAYYDTNADTAFTAGEPDNTEDVDITIEPVHHRMALVLDRSGSMFSPLPGSSESKWDATTRAAHIWLDLFAAFRAPADQTAGFLTFEDDSCGYGSAATASDVTFRDPATGAAAAGLSALSDFQTLSAINLGSPQSCTPIGDAMVQAFKSLSLPPLGDLDAATILLLTDGYENSGAVSVKADAPVGASSTVETELNALPVLKSKLAIYSLGAGSSVDEDALNNLPGVAALGAKGGGYYRLATELGGVLESFGQMIGDSVDAQDLGATIDNSAPAAFFTTNSGERRLAVIVPWTNPADTLQLSHREQGSSDPWVVVPIAPASGTTLQKRATHGILIVELALALTGLPSTARDWRIERLSGSTPQTLTEVLAMVDLHLKVEVAFDKPVYQTGEPMRISCTIIAGREPVAGATVVAEGSGPDLGLGTYLTHQGVAAFGPIPVTDLKIDLPPRDDAPQRGDPDAPKAMLFHYLLERDGLPDLPRSNLLFEDGTDRLFDDGAHDDGAADDGVYANRFVRTDKEGTYTFRFRAEGTLADGSRFRRVITVSRWVGVTIDPGSSPVLVQTLANPPAGFLGQTITVTPRDARGEYLGPLRESDVRITATAGTFTAPVASRLDGSYTRTLLYRPGERPELSVVVRDQPLAACPPGDQGCWKLIFRGIKCLLRKIIGVFRR